MITNSIESGQVKKQIKQRPKIYILPPAIERNLKALRVLFLTDGNNRARGLNQGYEAGGKKVVEIAEHLAGRGDVNEMIACIMSEENALKRSDQFFEKMYQAFMGLGVGIQTKGALVKSGIRMEVEGDLVALAKRGPIAADLALMIETVCSLTDVVERPRMTLKLGVNYDKDVALDTGVDLIFRSGMEEPATVRLSGMRSHRGIDNVGSTTLWPNLTTEEVDAEIQRSKERFKKECGPNRLGYDMRTILQIVDKTCRMIRENADITIPYVGSLKEATALLPLQDEDLGQAGWSLSLYDKLGVPVISEEQDKVADSLLRVVPAAFQKLPNLDLHPYESFVYPGRYSSRFILPERPTIDYATVHYADPDPTGICLGIGKAIDFCLNHEALKGADRLSTARKDNNEQQMDSRRERESLQHLEMMMGKFLAWAPEIDAPIDTLEKRNAYINYIIISYFIAFDPANRDRGRLDDNELGLAEWLTKYMQLVYTGDEAIFDLNLPGETAEQRHTRLTKSADYLRQSLGRKGSFAPEAPDVQQAGTLVKIANNWHEFEQYFDGLAHPDLLRDWLTDLDSLYACSVNEYDPAKTANPLIDMLRDTTQDREAVVTRLKEDYFGKIPSIVRSRIEELLALLPLEKTCNCGTILRELRLWLYLSDIKTTIGAGLVLRTVALGLPKEEITTEQIVCLQETCSFFDYFVRLANDLSDSLKRSMDDQDPKDDSCKIIISDILQNQDVSPIKAKITGISEIKTVFDWIQARFGEELMHFRATWPAMAQMFDRADYVKNLYREGHFRTVDVKGMIGFLEKYN